MPQSFLKVALPMWDLKTRGVSSTLGDIEHKHELVKRYLFSTSRSLSKGFRGRLAVGVSKIESVQVQCTASGRMTLVGIHYATDTSNSSCAVVGIASKIFKIVWVSHVSPHYFCSAFERCELRPRVLNLWSLDCTRRLVQWRSVVSLALSCNVLPPRRSTVFFSNRTAPFGPYGGLRPEEAAAAGSPFHRFFGGQKSRIFQERQSEHQDRLSALGAGTGAADVEYEQFLKAKEVSLA